MAKFERVEDKWKILRKDLYGNVEPSVELRAITVPIILGNEMETDFYFSEALTGDLHDEIDFKQIEQLPAISAGVSYGATEKLENDNERAIKLNKKLIADGHDTPLEAIQMNFRVKGLSKTAGAQLSRYRTGNGHVSASRRFRTAGISFVYPLLEYIDDKDSAEGVLNSIARVNEDAYDCYKGFREGKWFMNCPVIHKEDARQVLPVSYATEREWWVNVRALRYIFKQRLKADTESELRRLCWMIYDMIQPLMPSLFCDIDAVIRMQDEPSRYSGSVLYLGSMMQPGCCPKCGNASIPMGSSCPCDNKSVP